MTRHYHLRLPLRAPLGGSWTRDVTLVEGSGGWGEFSPLPGYPCDESAAWAAADEAAAGRWPPARRQRVPVAAFVPAVTPDEAAALAAEAVEARASCIKVKVGDPSDAARVAAVRAAAGHGVSIRVDANGAWDVEEAIRSVRRLSSFGLEMVEQPVARLEGMATVRRRVDVPVAADESVRTVDDARRLAALGAADVVVLKVQPLGGVHPALEVAEAAGVPAVVSSMYETSVGLAAGVALAAALPELPYACGLGTASLLAADVVGEPLVASDGELEVRRPVPDTGKLEAYARGARL